MTNHTIDLLEKSDGDLFTKGGCHVFAVCLAKTLACPIRLLRNTHVPLPGGIVHVYCMPADDVMIDFDGRRSECSYRQKNRYDFPPYEAETVSVGFIEKLYVHDFGHGGLYAEPCFVEVARKRAEAAISAGGSKYECSVSEPTVYP
jgi:hypothetical protein